MNFAKFLILFVVIGVSQAQIELIQTRPGNYSPPTIPLWGVRQGSGIDTQSLKTVKNVGKKSITFSAASLQVKSPGLEGEWYLSVTLNHYGKNSANCDIQGIQSQYAYCYLNEIDEVILHPQEQAMLGVTSLYECAWLMVCKTDTTVKPPVYYFSYNTAKDVDTLDARLGLYWYDSLWTVDSAFIDCRIEFNRGKKYVERILPRNASAGSVPLQSVPGGWRVTSGTGWSLVDAQGHAIPLRQEPTSEGLRLMPTGARRGVGILRSREGQTYRVFMGM